MKRLTATKPDKGSDKWQNLIWSVVLTIASLYIFVEYVVFPAQNVFFATGGSMRAVISEIWFPFLLAGFMGKYGEYKWNMFNRSSMITQSYKIVKTSLLEGLPSEYSVYKDVQVDGTAISHVVVGPNGIFVILNRSINGTIAHPGEREQRWTIEKVGRCGTHYTSSMANPLKQARWQARQLSEYLRDNGCAVPWVEAAVVFTSGTTYCLPQNAFISPDALIGFIVNYEPRKPLFLSTADKAKEILSDIGHLE